MINSLNFMKCNSNLNKNLRPVDFLFKIQFGQKIRYKKKLIKFWIKNKKKINQLQTLKRIFIKGPQKQIGRASCRERVLMPV